MKEGHLLKKIIESQDTTLKQIIAKSGISKGTFYNLFEGDAVDDYYKERLKRAGIDYEKEVQKVKKVQDALSSDLRQDLSSNALHEKDKRIDALEQKVDLLSRLLKAQEKSTDRLEGFSKEQEDSIAHLTGSITSLQNKLIMLQEQVNQLIPSSPTNATAAPKGHSATRADSPRKKRNH